MDENECTIGQIKTKLTISSARLRYYSGEQCKILEIKLNFLSLNGDFNMLCFSYGLNGKKHKLHLFISVESVEPKALL